jgi:hypothetical protein
MSKVAPSEKEVLASNATHVYDNNVNIQATNLTAHDRISLSVQQSRTKPFSRGLPIADGTFSAESSEMVITLNQQL